MAKRTSPPYLMGDQDLINAASAMHRAQESASDGEIGGEGIPAYLYVLLSVKDDVRHRLAQDPNWLMEDHASDPDWEAAQEAFADWDHVHSDWVMGKIEELGNDWPAWVQAIRGLIAHSRVEIQ